MTGTVKADMPVTKGDGNGEEDALRVIYEARRQARSGEAPARERPWRRRLIIGGVAFLVVLATTVGAYVWWTVGHVRTAQAQVCAELISLSPDIDGRVREVCARPGEKVVAGQVLFRLEDSGLRAALAAAQARVVITRSRCARARANLRRQEAAGQAQIRLTRAGVERAAGRIRAVESSLALCRERLAAEIRRAEALRDEAKARLEYLKKGPRREEIEVARLRLETAKALVEFYTIEVQETRKLVDKGFDSPHMLKSKELELIARRNAMREAELALSNLEAGPRPEEVSIVEKTLAAREAAVFLARAGRKEADVLAAELAAARAARKEAEAELASARAQGTAVAAAEVEAAEAELAEAEAQAARQEAALAGASVCSPTAGTLIRTFARVGESCQRGRSLALVADDSRGRWVEGFVHEYQAGLIRPGQKAKIEIVVGSGRYVDGAVESVGLATSTPGAAGPNGIGSGAGPMSGQLVWVKFKTGDDGSVPLPGMTARATINLRD